jgi:hypothetical protein
MLSFHLSGLTYAFISFVFFANEILDMNFSHESFEKSNVLDQERAQTHAVFTSYKRPY